MTTPWTAPRWATRLCAAALGTVLVSGAFVPTEAYAAPSGGRQAQPGGGALPSAARPTPRPAASNWYFNYRYYRHHECTYAGSRGVPGSWTAYQCRTVDLGGETYAYDLWVCHDLHQCDLRRRTD
ncbi:hypothetical protein [Streptodolium elevatio]